MESIISEITKCFKVYLLFAKNCLMAQIEYRSNFFIVVSMETLWLFAKGLFLVIMYQSDLVIQGISPDGMLLLVGTYSIMTGIFNVFFLPNFYSISDKIRNGTLDLLITKPISLQFLLTFRTTEFIIPLPTVIIGLVMVIVAWVRLPIPLDVANIGGFVFYTGIGVLACYVIFLLPQLFSFWFVKFDMAIMFSEALWELNSVPLTVYNKWIQRIGLYVVPIFLVANLPVMFVLGKLSLYSAVLPILVLICLFFLLRIVWRIAIKNYTGASS